MKFTRNENTINLSEIEKGEFCFKRRKEEDEGWVSEGIYIKADDKETAFCCFHTNPERIGKSITGEDTQVLPIRIDEIEFTAKDH